LSGVHDANEQYAAEDEHRDDDDAGEERSSAHTLKTPTTTKWFP
jgi:hypothetical protein